MFRRKRQTSDFGAEIEAHIELEAERLRAQGLSEEDARASRGRFCGLLLWEGSKAGNAKPAP